MIVSDVECMTNSQLQLHKRVNKVSTQQSHRISIQIKGNHDTNIELVMNTQVQCHVLYKQHKKLNFSTMYVGCDEGSAMH